MLLLLQILHLDEGSLSRTLSISLCVSVSLSLSLSFLSLSLSLSLSLCANAQNWYGIYTTCFQHIGYRQAGPINWHFQLAKWNYKWFQKNGHELLWIFYSNQATGFGPCKITLKSSSEGSVKCVEIRKPEMMCSVEKVCRTFLEQRCRAQLESRGADIASIYICAIIKPQEIISNA